jgi:hypothetical protein
MLKNTDVISREFVHQDLVFTEGNSSKTHNRDDFYNAVSYWKIILYEGYNLRPGDRICIYDSTVGFLYSTLFFAAAELGIEIISPPEKAIDTSGYVDKMEIMALDRGLPNVGFIDDINLKDIAVAAMCKRYSGTLVNQQIFFDYTIKDHKLYKELSDTIFAKPDDILVTTTTSGSTGLPKIVSYTHKQLHRLAIRNAELLDFKNHAICHTRNMHHAFVLFCHLLSTFYATPKHYSFPLVRNETELEFVNFVKEKKISRLALSYKGLLDSMLLTMINNDIKFEHDLDIIVGGFHVSAEYIDAVKKTNVKNIKSIFGSNEAFGPIFVKITNQESDIETYRSDWFPPAPDNFMKINSLSDKISVTVESLGVYNVLLDDTLVGDNISGYVHKGRDNLFRINEIDFKIHELNTLISPYCTGDFDVCADPANQKLHLAIWSGDVDFAKVNQAMILTYKELWFDDYAKLDKNKFSGFKVEMALVRNYFRNLKK